MNLHQLAHASAVDVSLVLFDRLGVHFADAPCLVVEMMLLRNDKVPTRNEVG